MCAKNKRISIPKKQKRGQINSNINLIKQVGRINSIYKKTNDKNTVDILTLKEKEETMVNLTLREVGLNDSVIFKF